jgi:hypothetical protein
MSLSVICLSDFATFPHSTNKSCCFSLFMFITDNA